tara:strand:+ start:1570 stop:1824 length:255 start_codon:yes stop_codon:yes gene_type:complete
MGVLHHVIGRAKEGYRWIGNNPLKAAAIGGGVATGLGAAAVYGPSVLAGAKIGGDFVGAPFKVGDAVLEAAKGAGLAGLSMGNI